MTIIMIIGPYIFLIFFAEISQVMRKTSVLNSPRNKHDTAGLVVNYSTCISNTTVLEMPWFTNETALQYYDIIGSREAPPQM